MNYKEEIKAVVFDFDGTLIDFNYNATDYTRKALDLLKDCKYKVCLSSGRPCFLAKKAFENVFGDYPLDYIFGCNGAELYDCKNDKTTLLHSLTSEEIVYLGNVLECDFLMTCMYNGQEFLVNKYIDEPEINEWLDARWLKPIVYDFNSNTIPRSKIIVLNRKADRAKEIEFVESKKDALSKFSYAFSSPHCLEFAPNGVSKATGINKLCEILGCDNKQILSFGDMGNDMPMLLNSTGVIMDNAVDEFKAQIPLHTSRVDEMGVYEFLHNNEMI